MSHSLLNIANIAKCDKKKKKCFTTGFAGVHL